MSVVDVSASWRIASRNWDSSVFDCGLAEGPAGTRVMCGGSLRRGVGAGGGEVSLRVAKAR